LIERLMKRFVVIAILLFCQEDHPFSAWALSINTHTENWLAVNLEYGCFFKNPLIPDATAENQYGSFGTGLAFYSFFNWQSWGYFIRAYFLFPGVTISKKTGGLITTDEVVDALMGLIIGPAYHIVLQNDAYLYFAGGFHISYLNGSYSTMFPGTPPATFQYDLGGFNIGIGGEAGFKYNMTEIFYLNFGLTFVMDFFSKIYLDDPDKVKPQYLWINLKPFFGFGITLTSDHSWYLKIGNGG
jgi:hypothetical protein